MRRTISLVVSLLAGACAVSAAEWPKQDSVQIKDVPDSELCRATSRAVADLRNDIGWPMTQLYGQGEGHADRTVQQLTFAGLRVQSIELVNGSGEKRTLPLAFYRMDIDNTPPLEMIGFVTGGHLAAGGGTTLTVMRKDLSSAPQPIPERDLGDAALVIGPLEVAFGGKDFDAGYYIYPFAFAGRNYLFVEGNGEQYPPQEDREDTVNEARDRSKDAVVELVRGIGIVPRCYFTAEPK